MPHSAGQDDKTTALRGGSYRDIRETRLVPGTPRSIMDRARNASGGQIERKDSVAAKTDQQLQP